MVLQLLYDEIKWYILNSVPGGQEVNQVSNLIRIYSVVEMSSNTTDMILNTKLKLYN